MDAWMSDGWMEDGRLDPCMDFCMGDGCIDMGMT